MTLVVHTARISSADPDCFNVTRKSGGRLGAVFAPSWDLLRPALAARREATELRRRAYAIAWTTEHHRSELLQHADDLERRAWTAYEPAYDAEMHESYRRHPEAWRALLARERVVLVCYCTDADHCHRTLLAAILGKLGADVRGELL